MALKSVLRSFILGAGAGAAAVYFNDPERGEMRREEFSKKASATMNNLSQVADDAKEMAGQAGEQAQEMTEQAQQKAQEAKEKAEQKAEDRDQSSGAGRDSTVDLTSGSGATTGATTPGQSDPLYVPGQRPI